MTARTATVRCYVALVALLTAVLALLGAAVRLVAALVSWAASAAQARAARRAVHQKWTPPSATAPTVRAPAPLRIVPSPTPTVQARKLVTALTGLGFRAPEVRSFVAGLGPRVEHESLEALIKDGLRILATAA